MIVSVDKDESQIWPPYNVKVLLNGEQLKTCLYADDEQGYAIIHVKDPDGNYVLTTAGDDVEQRKLYGDIKILVGDDV